MMLNSVFYLDGIKRSASPQFELHTHSRLFVVNINRNFQNLSKGAKVKSAEFIVEG